MRKIAGVICIMMAVIIGAIWGFHYGPIFMDYKKSADLYKELKKDCIQKEEEVPDPDIKALLPVADHLKDKFAPIDVDSETLQDQNADYIGWIYIPDTDISYPVVKSSDNADYLHTDFNKNYSFPGTVFMDCRCQSGVLNHHSILYGHNMNNGTMFAGLKYFSDQEYMNDHPVFWFITPKYKLLYRIFSVCDASPYDKIQYGVDGTEYKNNEEFGDAMKVIQDHSVVEIDTDPVEDTGFVMSLSTCTGNDSVRRVVHGVLLKAIFN